MKPMLVGKATVVLVGAYILVNFISAAIQYAH